MICKMIKHLFDSNRERDLLILSSIWFNVWMWNASQFSLLLHFKCWKCVASLIGRIFQDKILQSNSTNETVQVTNDGATILKSIGVDNPAAKVLVGMFQIQCLFQYRECIWETIWCSFLSMVYSEFWEISYENVWNFSVENYVQLLMVDVDCYNYMLQCLGQSGSQFASAITVVKKK